MGETDQHKSRTMVLIVDMQEGMWLSDSVENDPEVPEDMREILQRNLTRMDDKRETAMGELAQDIQSFADSMRENGAQIVWVLTDTKLDERWGGIHKDMNPDEEADIFLNKTAKSALKENTEFFEKQKADAEAEGADLEIKACGVWANDCVAHTVVDLSNAGYDVKAVSDMILDFGKPCMDGERPGNNEGYALYNMAEKTGRGADIADTSKEILFDQITVNSYGKKYQRSNSEVSHNDGPG